MMTVSIRYILIRTAVAALSLLVLMAGAMLLSASAHAHGTTVELTHQISHVDTGTTKFEVTPCQAGDMDCDPDHQSRKGPCSAAHSAHCAQTGLAEAWTGVLSTPERRKLATPVGNIGLQSLISLIEPPPPRV